MAKEFISISNIYGGHSAAQLFAGDSQYLQSIAVDPELPLSDAVGDRFSSGMIRPTAYQSFDGSEIDANPYWFITNPKDAKVYTVLNNGKLVSYNSSLGGASLEATATSSVGNGAAYYNNYIYISTNTDVTRFGPLDGTPTKTDNFWTSTLGKTALTNTTYPSIRGAGTLPNHVMHVHVDNKLYIADVVDGQGVVHFIRTTKTTDEGDTNDGSLFNVLDLPLNYLPTCIASYGNDIVIGAIQTTDGVVKQGKAALFFWNTIDDSFYNIVDLPDPLVTALQMNNVTRFGPLDGTPTKTDNFWTSTLGKTALTNTTYPSIRGAGTLPNHVMHVHVDNKLYIADVVDGQGVVHFIRTTKTTDEGDTNDGSLFNVLDLPLNYLPTCIASYGNDIVIGAIQTTDGVVKQGKAALFFWNTIDDSFYNIVDLPDPLVTALQMNNGTLFAWTGAVSDGANESNGYRLCVYAGGQTVQTIHYSEVGAPPLPGAVDAFGDRVIWGTFTQLQGTNAGSPEYHAVAMSYGSKNPAIPGGLHCIARSTATASASDGLVTALKYVQQESFSRPKMIMGWRDASGYGLDKSSTNYGTWYFRKAFNIGRKFTVTGVRLPLGDAVAANTTIQAKIYTDNFSASSTDGLTEINNTNYPGAKYVQHFPNISGDHDFVLELKGTGSNLMPVQLPIVIEVEIEED